MIESRHTVSSLQGEDGMRRGWTAVAVPVFLSGMFAQQNLLSDPGRYALGEVQVGPATG
jgi:hypothetical protein